MGVSLIVILLCGVLVVLLGIYYLIQKPNTIEEVIEGDTEVITGQDLTEEDVTSDEMSGDIQKEVGYIKDLYVKTGKKYLDIDYIQWFTGEEAFELAMKDTGCGRNEVQTCVPSLNNGFYIKNENPKIRTFEVVGGLNTDDVVVSDHNPFYLEIKDNKIISITKQYIP